MAEIVKGEERKEYEEEVEYQDTMRNTIRVPSQSEEIAERRAARNEPQEPNEPNPADQSAQQRRQEEKERRHSEFKAQRAMSKAQREAAERASSSAKSASSRQQAKELKELESSRYGSEREEMEGEVEHYRSQHPERSTRDTIYVAKGKAKDIGGGIFSKMKEKVTGPSRWDKIREENIRKQTAGGKGLTREDVQKMIAGKKGMSKGQFHAPGSKYSTSFIDPFPHGGGKGGGFPMVDPLGGMGGSGKHMMDFSMGPRPVKTQVRATVVSRPPPRPIAKAPKMFGDPFAGLPKGGPKKSFDVQKDVGKGLGLGYGKKSAKKLRNVSDWMNF